MADVLFGLSIVAVLALIMFSGIAWTVTAEEHYNTLDHDHRPIYYLAKIICGMPIAMIMIIVAAVWWLALPPSKRNTFEAS